MLASEKGQGLIDILVALAIISGAVVAFLAALSQGMAGVTTMGERLTAERLARSQMEYAKGQDYIPFPAFYTTVAPPSPSYSVVVHATDLPGADGNIQKLTVQVGHNSRDVFILEGFKLNR